MIGSFLYSSRPRPEDVAVWLQRRGDASSARIVLPVRLERLLVEGNYPPPAPLMSIESALSYAVFLAMRTGTSLVITGERAAWNPEWGYLTDLGTFAGHLVTPAGRAGD